MKKLFDINGHSKNPITRLIYKHKRDNITKDIFYINERMSCENMTEYGFIPIYTFLDIFDKLGGTIYTYGTPIYLDTDKEIDKEYQIIVSEQDTIKISWTDDIYDEYECTNSILFTLHRDTNILYIMSNIKGIYRAHTVHDNDYISANQKFESVDQIDEADKVMCYLKLFNTIQIVYLDVLRAIFDENSE